MRVLREGKCPIRDGVGGKGELELGAQGESLQSRGFGLGINLAI